MKYRKKPVAIEAVRFSEVIGTAILWYCDPEDMPEWLNDAIRKPRGTVGAIWVDENHEGRILVGTLEGNHQACPDDVIIQGVKGELYPCKPDIFAATYDPV